jgi:hypothetical protein
LEAFAQQFEARRFRKGIAHAHARLTRLAGDVVSNADSAPEFIIINDGRHDAPSDRA